MSPHPCKGACRWLGFGPGMAPRCTHPLRHCVPKRSCRRFVEWPGRPRDPLPVDLAAWCNTYHDNRGGTDGRKR